MEITRQHDGVIAGSDDRRGALNFQRVALRVARATALLLIASLGACSKHETQTPTSWLRIDVATPRADDMIRVGARREVYEINRDGRWKRVGIGHSSSPPLWRMRA